MTAPISKTRNDKQVWRSRWLTVALPCAATLAVLAICFAWAKNWERRQVRSEFEHRSLVLSNSMQREVETLLSGLDDIEDFFAGSQWVDKDEFLLFATRLMARTPGLVGMGYAPRITPENKDAWTKDAAKQGVSPWRIYDLDTLGFPTEPQPRAEQFPLFYVAPDKLSYAVGMTLTHEPLRRTAIEYALQTGGTGVTSHLYFSRNAGKRLDSTSNTEVESRIKRPAGHYAFRPLRAAAAYRSVLPMTWTPADRDSVRGLLVAAFRLPEILEKACGPDLTSGISLSLIDSAAPPEARELFSSNHINMEGTVPGGFGLAGGTSPLKWTRQIQVGGRNWTMEFATTPGFLAARRSWTAWVMLVAGLLFAALLAVFLWMLTGRHAHAEAMVEDRTRALKETFDALVKAKEEALSASRAKSEFLATMSHEIRTPMNGVLGMVSLLQLSEMNPAKKGDLRTIQTSGEALLRILDEILDFSKIEAGRVGLQSAPFNLRIVIEEVCGLFRPRAKQSGVELSLEYPNGLPQYFSGDAGRIRQILANLCGNAVKFTHQGSVRIVVTGRALPEGKMAMEIRVVDTGIGIPEDKQSSLFQPFSQVDSGSNRRYGGTGLGLAICKRLALLMDGEIRAESSAGRGSSFILTLPLRELDGDSAIGEIASATVRGSSQAFPRSSAPKALLVEDHWVNQKVAAQMLEKLGCVVEVVGEGAVAAEMVKRGRYAFVLMDVQMAGWDGYETTRRIRAWERETGMVPIPIIALTANAMAGDRERCLEAGMNDYLSKPIFFNLLRDTVAPYMKMADRI
ncbi:MAG: ATP-binding protein [Fibrobacteria bacterium]